MKWTINVTKLPQKRSGLNFSFDSPKNETIEASQSCSITFSGWVVIDGTENARIVFDYDPNTKHELNVDRPDVIQKLGAKTLKCGFSKPVTVGRNFRVGICINEDIDWLALFKFEPVGVLEGRNGYLFLDYDSNKSLLQYKGTNRIDNTNIKLWADYFNKINKIKESLNFKHVFLLAPSKEYVYPDYYPAWRQGVTPVDQLLTHFSEENNIIFPLEALIEQRNYSYPKTDTHWTDYGAGIVAQLVCEKLGAQFNDPKFKYAFINKSGDLGRKFMPQKSEAMLRADFSLADKYIIFNNHINNRGWIRIFFNPDAIEKQTCVVFGDSFSVNFVNFLITSFHRVVHVFSGADIDSSILNYENPAYVVTEITTRFLIKAPFSDYSIKYEYARKEKSLSTSERMRISENMKKYINGELSFYAELTLSSNL